VQPESMPLAFGILAEVTRSIHTHRMTEDRINFAHLGVEERVTRSRCADR
jgi:hypothetical protein